MMIAVTTPGTHIAIQSQPVPEIKRPVTRGDCKYGPRPCPWYSCKHHLIWVASKRFARMTDEQILDYFDKAPYSCDLDFIDENETRQHGDQDLVQLNVIADAVGLSKQRIDQILHGQTRTRQKTFKGKTYSYSYANPGGAISKFNKRFRAMARREKP